MALLRMPAYLARFLLLSVLLALTQIWMNKTRSALTTTGIVIGVAAVTAVVAALTGLRANILQEFANLGTNKLYIVPERPQTGPLHRASWQVIRFKPDLFDDFLEHCPSISNLTRIGESSAKVSYRDQYVDGARVIGIEPPWHQIENRSILAGRPFSLLDGQQSAQVCLITLRTRDRLRMDRDCVGESIYIRDRRFLVVGLVEDHLDSSMFAAFGGPEVGLVEVFVPFQTHWNIWRESPYVIATSRSPSLSDEAQAEARFFLHHKRNLKPDEPDTFRIDVIELYLRQFNRLALGITAIAGGIVGISLLVGGVGIMNIMLVSVSERTREIGLRKAVGARPAAILFQFLIEAITLCALGGVVGILGGQLFTIIIASLPGAHMEGAYIPYWAVAMSIGFSALVGVFFGMFPAFKAARLDPIEALRHE